MFRTATERSHQSDQDRGGSALDPEDIVDGEAARRPAPLSIGCSML
jgi:hypothetical protein